MNFGEWDAGPTSLQLPRVVSDGERRPDGTFGIVLVSSRNAKDRHEPVSHHLGDGPAVVLYDPHQRGHARPHERVDFFRIERRRECGEPGQVREQQRDELSSPLARRWGRRSSRGGAEARSYTEGLDCPPTCTRSPNSFKTTGHVPAPSTSAGTTLPSEATRRKGSTDGGRQESGCLRRSPVGNRHLHAADAVDSSELLHVPA